MGTFIKMEKTEKAVRILLQLAMCGLRASRLELKEQRKGRDSKLLVVGQLPAVAALAVLPPITVAPGCPHAKQRR